MSWVSEEDSRRGEEVGAALCDGVSGSYLLEFLSCQTIRY